MKILVTGCCGFIGFNFVENILKKRKKVKIVGIDNLDSYYSIKLKKNRLKLLLKYKNFSFAGTVDFSYIALSCQFCSGEPESPFPSSG